jgi:hypothetical protein
MKKKLLLLIIFMMFCIDPKAQTITKDYKLPGKGINQHPFLYVGEWDVRNQTATRLTNGNTVITNWCAGNKNIEEWAGTVQVFEVTPDKKVVWALSSWENPDLGPCTYIQLLDEPGNPDNGGLQR